MVLKGTRKCKCRGEEKTGQSCCRCKTLTGTRAHRGWKNNLSYDTLRFQIGCVMQRLDRLEQENRWWKLLGIAAVAMVGLAILWGASGNSGNKDTGGEKELRARRFPGLASNGSTHVP